MEILDLIELQLRIQYTKLNISREISDLDGISVGSIHTKQTARKGRKIQKRKWEMYRML